MSRIRIGFPSQVWALPCRPNRKFRLASYSQDRLRETVRGNLECLRETLEYCSNNGYLFFRVSSDTIPFASHPVCDVRWQREFRSLLRECGRSALAADMRIAMHPDQHVVLNGPDIAVFERSTQELVYHVELLEAMGLDTSHKVQIHVGGVYGEMVAALRRFALRFPSLPRAVRERLVIENDDRLYGIGDCLRLHEEIGIPVVLDVYHLSIRDPAWLPSEALARFRRTWSRSDGPPMLDYSSGEPGKRIGTHATSIDMQDFRQFLDLGPGLPLDIMLEIRDKEASAELALAELKRRHLAG